MSLRLFYAGMFVFLLGCGHKGGPQTTSTTVSNALPAASSALPPNQVQNTNPVPPEDVASAPQAAASPGQPEPTAPPEPVERRPSPYTVREPAAPPHPTLTIPAGTEIRVRLAETLDTKHIRAGDRFTATLDSPLTAGYRVAVPKGTTFRGHVTEAKASGRLKGRGVLGMVLDSFELQGATYSVQTSSDVRTSASHKKRNLAFIGGGTGVGAAIGGLAGGGMGAGIGAGAGAVAGTTGALITGKRNVKLPVESTLRFSLRHSIQVKSLES